MRWQLVVRANIYFIKTAVSGDRCLIKIREILSIILSSMSDEEETDNKLQNIVLWNLQILTTNLEMYVYHY